MPRLEGEKPSILPYIIGLGLLAAIGAGVYFYTQNNQGQDTTGDNPPPIRPPAPAMNANNADNSAMNSADGNSAESGAGGNSADNGASNSAGAPSTSIIGNSANNSADSSGAGSGGAANGAQNKSSNSGSATGEKGAGTTRTKTVTDNKKGTSVTYSKTVTKDGKVTRDVKNSKVAPAQP